MGWPGKVTTQLGRVATTAVISAAQELPKSQELQFCEIGRNRNKGVVVSLLLLIKIHYAVNILILSVNFRWCELWLPLTFAFILWFPAYLLKHDRVESFHFLFFAHMILFTLVAIPKLLAFKLIHLFQLPCFTTCLFKSVRSSRRLGIPRELIRYQSPEEPLQVLVNQEVYFSKL